MTRIKQYVRGLVSALMVSGGMLFAQQADNLTVKMASGQEVLSDSIRESVKKILSRPPAFPTFSSRERFLNQRVEVYVRARHFSPPGGTAEDKKKLSSMLFNEYFKHLDFQKLYFLESDLDDFRSYEYELCDDRNRGRRLQFVEKVYLRMLTRVRRYAEYSLSCLDKPMDFSRKETITVDRKDAAWCRTEEELEREWYLRVKNSLLIERLSEEANEAKKEKRRQEGKPEEPKAVAFKRPPIRERLAKMYAQTYETRLEKTALEIMEGFLDTYLRLWDPHTVYWAPASREDFDIQMRLSLQGIGATLTMKDSYCEVVSLVVGGPADKEGTLKEGDRIVEVCQDGAEPVNVVDMNLTKIVKQIRGKKGTAVTLTILDANSGEMKHVRIVRDEVKLKDAEATSEIKSVKLDDGQDARVLVISLPSFYADFDGKSHGLKDYKSSSKDVEKLLKAAVKDNKIDGVVLDLRGNGGGSLNDAVALAGLFFKSGPVVQISDRFGRKQQLDDPDSGCVYDGPLFVMVDRGSASASEIVAAALQDMGRALVIGGATTHGKGSVQSAQDLGFLPMASKEEKNSLGSVKVTTMKFYRINGASTQLKGVSSDIVMPFYLDSLDIGEGKLPHALPWNEIKSTKYERFPGYKDVLPQLRKSLAEYWAKSAAHQEYVKDLAEYDALEKQKTISLEYESRKAYREHSEEVMKKIRRLTAMHKNSRREKRKNRTEEELEEEKNSKDLIMDETLFLMGRYLELRKAK